MRIASVTNPFSRFRWRAWNSALMVLELQCHFLADVASTLTHFKYSLLPKCILLECSGL